MEKHRFKKLANVSMPTCYDRKERKGNLRRRSFSSNERVGFPSPFRFLDPLAFISFWFHLQTAAGQEKISGVSGSRFRHRHTTNSSNLELNSNKIKSLLYSDGSSINGSYLNKALLDNPVFSLTYGPNQTRQNRRGNQEEEEGNDGGDNNEGNNQNEDNNNNNERQGQDGPGNDDFFDDYIQDDFLTNDDAHYVTWDDTYYAYGVDVTPKLFPLDNRVIVGFTISSLALFLAASGGTGGGGLVVPIYILVVGLPIQAAIPVGAMTVLGASLASTSLNWNRRHPLADRVLIDWDLVLVMEPLTLIGTLLGTLFHRLLSEKILIVLLVLLLSITAKTSLSKAMRMYNAEKRYIRHLKAANAEPPLSGSPTSVTWDENEILNMKSIVSEGKMHGSECKIEENPKTNISNSESKVNVSDGNIDGKDEIMSREVKIDQSNLQKQKKSYRQKLKKEEKEEILILNPDFITLRSELIEQEKFTPRSKIIALLSMLSIITFLNVMVGGGAYKSPWDIICGSTAFWYVHVIMIVFLVSCAWAAQTYVVARHEIKELVRFDYVHGDIRWDARSALIYPAVFVTAGLFAGTLGIGGGLITVPIMLAMGVHPGVVTATSSAMITFTSFASTTSFLIFGVLLPEFGVVGFCVGFVSSYLGNLLMRQARQARSATGRNFERNSFIAFAIGGVVLVSALLMTVQYVFTIVEEPDDKVGLCDGLRF